jgi:hypothetical protein
MKEAMAEALKGSGVDNPQIESHVNPDDPNMIHISAVCSPRLPIERSRNIVAQIRLDEPEEDDKD